jgi:hypothetical protein
MRRMVLHRPVEMAAFTRGVLIRAVTHLEEGVRRVVCEFGRPSSLGDYKGKFGSSTRGLVNTYLHS